MQPVDIDLNFLNIVIGTLIPLAVGLVTKWDASSALKAWANATLSAVAAAVQTVLAACGEAVCTLAWEPFLSTLFVTWVTSIATYYGLWKPTQTSAKVQAKTSTFGIGKSQYVANDKRDAA